MATIFEGPIPAGDEPQVGLVDQGGRLERPQAGLVGDVENLLRHIKAVMWDAVAAESR